MLKKASVLKPKDIDAKQRSALQKEIRGGNKIRRENIRGKYPKKENRRVVGSLRMIRMCVSVNKESVLFKKYL